MFAIDINERDDERNVDAIPLRNEEIPSRGQSTGVDYATRPTLLGRPNYIRLGPLEIRKACLDYGGRYRYDECATCKLMARPEGEADAN